MEMSEEKEQTPQKHKGGRPPKRTKKSNHLMVRLTPNERFLIEGKAKQASMKPSEWFRQSAIKAKVVARLSPEDMRWLRTLQGMGNNLNQLTRQAYKDGLFTLARVCQELLKEIAGILKNFYNNDRENT